MQQPEPDLENDLEYQLSLLKLSNGILPPLKHLPLESIAEVNLWRAIQGHRIAEAWTSSDQTVIYELVKLAGKIEKMQKELEECDYIVTDRHGDIKAHPLCTVLRGLQSRDLNLRRALSLNMHSAMDVGMGRGAFANGERAQRQARAALQEEAKEGRGKQLLAGSE